MAVNTGSFIYKGSGAARSFTGLGAVDMLVFKAIDAVDSHYVYDSVRGAQKSLRLDGGGQQTDAQSVTSFDADGFSLGTSSKVNTLGTYYEVRWWKKASGFFDIVSDTGTNAAHAINHNLGVTPIMIWRARDESGFGAAWNVYHTSLNAGTTPEQYNIQLSSNAAEASASTAWNNTAPSSTQFTVGTLSSNNTNGAPFITYLWGNDAAQIAIGHFTTDGSGNSTISGKSFNPRTATVKRATGTATSWFSFSKFRGWGSGADSRLSSDSTAAEVVSTDYGAPTSDGFTVTGLAASTRYIYFCFPDDLDVTDWFLPSTGASETISGGNSTDWTSASNITADDTSEAAWDVSSGTNATGPYLKATDFASIDDTALPSGSGIWGFQIERRRREVSSTDNIRDGRLRMIKGGSIQSTDFVCLQTSLEWANDAAESGSETVRNGGYGEMSGASFTDSDVKASNFGFAFSITHATGTSPSCRCEYVKLRVFFRAVTNVTLTIADASHAHASTAGTFSQDHTYAINNAAHAHSGQNATFSQVHALAVANAAHAHAAGNTSFAQTHSLAIQGASHAHSADGVTFAQVHSLAIGNASHALTSDQATFAQVHSFSPANAAHAHAAGEVVMGVDLPIDNAAHGVTSDTATFTQAHSLVIANAAHAHSAQSVTFAQVHSLVIGNAAHALTSDQATFSQNHVFAPQNAAHSHSAQNATVEESAILLPDNAAHALTSTAATFTQAHVLAVGNASHAQTADNATFSQVHTFAPANASHGHSATSGSFSQVHSYSPNNASHAHSADNVSFDIPILINSAGHAHAATAGSFTQNHVFAPNSAAHALTSDEVSFAVTAVLQPNDAAHSHTAQTVTFSQVHVVTIQNCSHAHSAGVGSFSQNHLVAIADGMHGHSAGNVTLSQNHLLAIQNAAHIISNTDPTFSQVHVLALQDCLHGHSASSSSFVQVHAISIADAVHAHSADEVELEATGLFIIDPARVVYVPLDDRMVTLPAGARLVDAPETLRLHESQGSARITIISARNRST